MKLALTVLAWLAVAWVATGVGASLYVLYLIRRDKD